MFKLLNGDKKQVAEGHTTKTLKHQAKRHQNQHMIITDENDTPIMERNAGTWRNL